MQIQGKTFRRFLNNHHFIFCRLWNSSVPTTPATSAVAAVGSGYQCPTVAIVYYSSIASLTATKALITAASNALEALTITTVRSYFSRIYAGSIPHLATLTTIITIAASIELVRVQ
jgi:hypothetical protein